MTCQFFRGITSFVFTRENLKVKDHLAAWKTLSAIKFDTPPREFINVLLLIMGLPRYIRNSFKDL